jgi:hypothetical protein
LQAVKSPLALPLSQAASCQRPLAAASYIRRQASRLLLPPNACRTDVEHLFRYKGKAYGKLTRSSFSRTADYRTPAWIWSSRPEGQLASAPTAGTHEILFDVKEIETDLSLALRMDPCVLRKPIFLLIKIFVLVFQLDKCAAGGSLISSKGFERLTFVDGEHASRCVPEVKRYQWMVNRWVGDERTYSLRYSCRLSSLKDRLFFETFRCASYECSMIRNMKYCFIEEDNCAP